MTNLQELECRFDGPIPEGMRRAAIALDSIAASRVRRTARVRIGQMRLKDESSIIRTMADCMIRTRARDGGCTEMDLLREGFSRDQVERLGSLARELASLMVHESPEL